MTKTIHSMAQKLCTCAALLALAGGCTTYGETESENSIQADEVLDQAQFLRIEADTLIGEGVFSADGKYLALPTRFKRSGASTAGSVHSQIEVFEVEAGKQLYTIPLNDGRTFNGGTSKIDSPFLSSNGDLVILETATKFPVPPEGMSTIDYVQTLPHGHLGSTACFAHFDFYGGTLKRRSCVNEEDLRLFVSVTDVDISSRDNFAILFGVSRDRPGVGPDFSGGAIMITDIIDGASLMQHHAIKDDSRLGIRDAVLLPDSTLEFAYSGSRDRQSALLGFAAPHIGMVETDLSEGCIANNIEFADQTKTKVALLIHWVNDQVEQCPSSESELSIIKWVDFKAYLNGQYRGLPRTSHPEKAEDDRWHVTKALFVGEDTIALTTSNNDIHTTQLFNVSGSQIEAVSRSQPGALLAVWDDERRQSLIAFSVMSDGRQSVKILKRSDFEL